MRWAFAFTAVAAVAAVGIFAIYTWGWRDPNGGRQAKLALADFETINYAHGSCCPVVSAHRVGDHAWLVRYRLVRREWDARHDAAWRGCFLIDLWRFKRVGELEYAGATRTRCAVST